MTLFPELFLFSGDTAASIKAGGQPGNFINRLLATRRDPTKSRKIGDDNDLPIDKSKSFLAQPSQGSAYMHHCQA